MYRTRYEIAKKHNWKGGRGPYGERPVWCSVHDPPGRRLKASSVAEALQIIRRLAAEPYELSEWESSPPTYGYVMPCGRVRAVPTEPPEAQAGE